MDSNGNQVQQAAGGNNMESSQRLESSMRNLAIDNSTGANRGAAATGSTS